MTDNVFQLQDKRNLAYAFYGPADGEPVFYFHGTPSSRLEPLLLNAYNQNIEDILLKNKIRLIAVDRPGMGLSTFNPKGSFTTFAHDVNELAGHLNIQSAKVLSWSGGGTYSLALAYHFPELIRGVFIIAGFTRSFSEPGVFKNMNGNVYYFFAAKYIPWLMRGIMNRVGRHNSDKPIPQWLSRLPDVDHELMMEPETMKYFSAVTLNEACRNGSKGIVHEAALYFKGTGYTLTEVKQSVHYWCGTNDNTVTRVHAQAIESQVPNSILHHKKNEGHLSIYINCFQEVLETIAQS